MRLGHLPAVLAGLLLDGAMSPACSAGWLATGWGYVTGLQCWLACYWMGLCHRPAVLVGLLLDGAMSPACSAGWLATGWGYVTGLQCWLACYWMGLCHRPGVLAGWLLDEATPCMGIHIYTLCIQITPVSVTSHDRGLLIEKS